MSEIGREDVRNACFFAQIAWPVFDSSLDFPLHQLSDISLEVIRNISILGVHDIASCVNDCYCVVDDFQHAFCVSAQVKALDSLMRSVPFKLSISRVYVNLLSKRLSFSHLLILSLLLDRLVEEVKAQLTLIHLTFTILCKVIDCLQFHHFEVIDGIFGLCSRVKVFPRMVVQSVIVLLYEIEDRLS